MKILLVLLLFSQNVIAQTIKNKEMFCDSIIMTDGSIKMLQIKEIKRKKIIYVLCCNQCTVPKEMNRSIIDTIHFANTKPIEQESLFEKDSLTQSDTLVGIVKKNISIEVKNEKGELVNVNDGEFVKITVKTSIYNSNKTKYKNYRGQMRLTKEGLISIGYQRFGVNEIEQIITYKKSSREWAKKAGWITLGSAAFISTTSTIVFASLSNTDILYLVLTGIIVAPLSAVFFKVWKLDREKNKYDNRQGWQFTIMNQE